MNTAVTHRLVGYDKMGRVAVEHEVNDHLLEFAKHIAGVGEDDPQAVLCYRLEPPAAGNIARAIGAKIDPGTLTFFLEGFAAP
jgi:hypothetical protein